MNVKELIESVKKSTPAVKGIPDAKATVLLREALKQIAQEVGKAKEGSVKVGGLGTFRVKMIDRVKDGKKETVKRVTFSAAAAKAAKAK